MCGRYRLSRRKELLAEYFETNFDDLDWEPRYNIAPTQGVPVLRHDVGTGTVRASLMRWGLVPSWASDTSAPMINARCETAASKPSFRDALHSRRCLIPADGFYEWRRRGKTKQPFCFEVGDGEVFAFAGLWDSWQHKDGTLLETCTILTTTPCDLVADVHDRMPVILAGKDHAHWLDGNLTDTRVVVSLLKPFDANRMRRHAVSALVNSVSNDGPGCSAVADLAPTLFD